MKKRLLSIILTIAMIVTLLPTSAMAASSTCSHQREHDALKNSSFYKAHGYLENQDFSVSTDYMQYSNEYEATCTKPMLAEWKCAECGFTICDTISGAQALGHDYDAWTISKEADCENAGLKYRTCKRCDAKQEEQIPAGEHAYGEWTTTKEATANEDGERVRECSVCHKEDKEVIPADPSLNNFSEIEIVIIQELLKEGGKYSGPVNGSFDKATEEAVEAYKSYYNLDDNSSVLVKLNDDYLSKAMDSKEEFAAEWGSGLKAELNEEAKYAANNDGTHETTDYIIGLVYTYNNKTRAIASSKKYEVGTYTDDCLLNNDKYACSLCGYAGTETKESIFGFGFIDFSDFSLCSGPVSGFPVITGASFVWDSFLMWDEFVAEDGTVADEYIIDLYKNYDASEEIFVGESVKYEIRDTFYLFDLSQYIKEGDNYVAIISAKANGEYISCETYVKFGYLSDLAPVSNIEVEDFVATWDEPYTDSSRVYYNVKIYNALAGTLIDERTTSVNSIDLFSINVDNGADAFYIAVTVCDTYGELADSETVYSEDFEAVEPSYWKPMQATYVRRGPSSEYEVMGTCPKGMILRAYGTSADGAYLVVEFGGQRGYIKASLVVATKPEYHAVKLDPSSFADGPIITRYTNIDGTLDLSFPSEWEIKDGYVFRGFKVSETASEYLDEDYIFTEDDAILAMFDADEGKSCYRLYDINQQDYEVVFMENGKEYVYFLPEYSNGIAVDWYTKPDGKGEMIDPNEPVPANTGMTTLYSFHKSRFNVSIRENGTPIYAEPDKNSEVICVLDKGKNVYCNENMKDAVKKGFYFVTTSDGKNGYIEISACKAYINVYFDAEGGYCSTKYIVLNPSTCKLDESKVPVPVKDGYIFTGWADEEGYSLENYYLGFKSVTSNMTLHATWIQDTEDAVRALIVAPDEHTTGEVSVSYKNSDGTFTGTSIYGGTEVYVVGEEYGKYHVMLYASIDHYPAENVNTPSYAVHYGNTTEGFYVDKSYVVFDYSTYTVSKDHYAIAARNSKGKIVVSKTNKYDNYKYYVIGGSGKYFKTANVVPGKITNYYIRPIDVDSCNTSKISLDPMGGTIVGGKRVYNVEKTGRIPELPTCSKYGYKFVGWYTEPEFGQVAEGATSNVTFYAHYVPTGESDEKLYIARKNAALYYDWSYPVKVDSYILSGTAFYASEYYEDGEDTGWLRHKEKQTFVEHDGTIQEAYLVQCEEGHRTKEYLLYKDAAADSEVVGTVRAGKLYAVLGEKGDFYKIWDLSREYKDPLYAYKVSFFVVE